MALAGQIGLVCALVASLISSVLLFVGTKSSAHGESQDTTKEKSSARKVLTLGYAATFVVAALLTVCVLIIAVGFFTANFKLEYVAKNYPDHHSAMQWLYLISGVWGGREGSLLFWAWLISVFNAWVAFWRRRTKDALSSVALAFSNLILAAFVATLYFSSSNNPFHQTPAEFLSEDGELIGMAMYWGMNKLLEHWAMVLHPPALFIGYAGMTLPFAYALATLVVKDFSAQWIKLVQRITLFSWVFLTIGIGLGAVWAYVVLGWGGYWGWDAVENASLLSWLTSTALLHSMTVYVKRDRFKMWSIMLAAITFIFVVLGTFITRSGIVQSVHAFSNDPVSTLMFMAMMVVSFVLTVALVLARRKGLAEDDDIESLFSKNGSYYLTNVILLASAVLIAYLTLAQALPAPLPLAGSVVDVGTYNLMARPIGIFFMAIAAVCPLLAWAKTDKTEFLKNIKIPAICAAVLFALLVAFFVTTLLPMYNADLAQGGDVAKNLLAQGPPAYYHTLALIGFLVGSLLFMNSLFLIFRGVSRRKTAKQESTGTALKNCFAKTPSQAAGFLAHAAMALLLIGLVGSAMYVQEHTFELAAEKGESLEIGTYKLEYKGLRRDVLANGDFQFSADFAVSHKGAEKTEIAPNIVVAQSMQQKNQQFIHAEVLTMPTQDLFVAFQGFSALDKMVITVKINPLILLVWAGLFLLVAAGVLAAWPKRYREQSHLTLVSEAR